MEPTLDPAAAPEPRSGLPGLTNKGRKMLRVPDLPNVYVSPKRALHPMIVAGIGFAAAGAIFYGAEMLLPAPYRPSSLIGGYDAAILEARKEGELAAQIRYDAQLRNVDLQHQAQLRQIETAAVQWQEQYRALMTGTVETYRATWTRANIFAQATADIQRQYVQTRTEYARRTLEGERSIANTATTLGYIFGMVSPELGDAAQDFADRARDQALSRLDAAATGGVTISIEGWDTGLTHPDDLARSIQALPPFDLRSFEPAPVTVPDVFVPRTEPADR